MSGVGAHDEHEVEVAVADLAHVERAGREPRAQVGAPVEVRLDGARLERLVAGRNGQSIQTRSWLSGSSIGDEMNRTCGASSNWPPCGVLAGMTQTSPFLTGRVTPPTVTEPGALEDVADLVVGRRGRGCRNGPGVALEDEHARLRAVAEVRPLEDVGLGQLVRLDRRGDVDDVDLACGSAC